MKLIFSKSFWITWALMLLSTGTYTYSESHLPSSSTKSNLNTYTKHLTLMTNINGFHLVLPADYYSARISRKTSNTKIPVTPSEKIMGDGLFDIHRMTRFLLSNNKQIDNTFAHQLAQIYFEEAKTEGVNPDVAFTQMCLETGFLRFDGTVTREQHNYCGLGVTGNGEKGHYFNSPREGVRAHIQHLKAYASTEKLNTELVDERFRFVKRGCATEISELTGKWATDKQYDKKIRNLLHRLSQSN
jgi:hypothetical protein